MDIWQFQLPIIQPIGAQLVDPLHHIVSSPTTHLLMLTHTALLPRTVLLWNNLPVEVPAAPSLDVFKAKVYIAAF